MRRKNREVTDPAERRSILEQCTVCRVAVRDDDGLYIVPMNFGFRYEQGRLSLYFHSAGEGRKVDAFARYPEVAFEMDCGHRLIEGGDACAYTYAYRSLVGSGRMVRVEDREERREGLSLLMKQYTGREFVFTDAMADMATVYRLDVREFTGKQKR